MFGMELFYNLAEDGLTTTAKAKKYSKKFRRVAIWDNENAQVIELITNQMSWTANTISELYRSRWRIEIFFREIKQLLHIKCCDKKRLWRAKRTKDFLCIA